jgi:hypothetical protein
MQKLVLPAWVTGNDRRILAEYIKGTKPAQLLAEYQLSHSELSGLRRQHGIPSQAELRSRGLLAPAPKGRKKAQELVSRRNIFGPKRLTLGEIKHNREDRLERCIAEHVANGTGIVALAKAHHVSTRELSELLRSKGLDIKRGRKPGTSPPREPSERDKTIIDLVITQGKTLESVARMQRPLITRERVRQIVLKAGYKLGHRRRKRA